MQDTKMMRLPTAAEALPGRQTSLAVPDAHHVLGTPLRDTFSGYATAMFGMGCFWGAEKMFWSLSGVHSTAVGYAGGFTPNPTYEEVCSGKTGHNEVVRIVYDPSTTPYTRLLRTFWENHHPTQGMRQGADVGTQYRSGIYYYTADQQDAAALSRQSYEKALLAAGYGHVTTEIKPATAFYFAEAYHQQYLAKNPHGYCGHGGTGVACVL